MSLEITKRSGFMLRMLSLLAFSCMVLFSGIVVMQNEELGKLIPPSTARTLAILFSYVVAMIAFNYALAIKGRNFMGWKNEVFIMIGYVIVFVGIFLPYAFPASNVIVTESWIPFSTKEITHFKTNWVYAPTTLLAIPFFYLAWKGLKNMPLWR